MGLAWDILEGDPTDVRFDAANSAFLPHFPNHGIIEAPQPPTLARGLSLTLMVRRQID